MGLNETLHFYYLSSKVCIPLSLTLKTHPPTLDKLMDLFSRFKQYRKQKKVFLYRWFQIGIKEKIPSLLNDFFVTYFALAGSIFFNQREISCWHPRTELKLPERQKQLIGMIALQRFDCHLPTLDSRSRDNSQLLPKKKGRLVWLKLFVSSFNANLTITCIEFSLSSLFSFSFKKASLFSFFLLLQFNIFLYFVFLTAFIGFVSLSCRS